MISKQKLFIGLIVAFLVGGAAGLAMGGFRGFQSGMSFILNECLAKDAREVGSRVAVLGYLRAGRQDQAVEGLEAGLDDILIGFDPVEPYPGLTGQTTAALGKAITGAREYRSAYPRQSKAHVRDEMVRNLFARERYK